MPTITRKKSFTQDERDKEVWAVHSNNYQSLDAIVRHVQERLAFAEFLQDSEIKPSELASVRQSADALCYDLQIIYDRLQL